MPETTIAGVHASHGIRQEIATVHAQVWENLGRPGNWLTGSERVAIVAEARAAWECKLCKERKQALSPYSLDGVHGSSTDLDPARVDAVHRIVTDPGRLTCSIGPWAWACFLCQKLRTGCLASSDRLISKTLAPGCRSSRFTTHSYRNSSEEPFASLA